MAWQTTCNSGMVRDATLLIICWYSLIVSLCMLYVLHTHSTIVDWNAPGSALGGVHSAHARSANSNSQNQPGWLRGAFKWNSKEITTALGTNLMTNASATSDYARAHVGYTLLDQDIPLDLHCDRCSLVSSSGQLIDSGAGADIDNADCVLRMNSAPVKGYEEDVGIRTDVRVIGHVNLARGLVLSDELREEILGDPATRTGIVVVPWLYQECINKTNSTVYSAARNMSEQYPHVKFYFLTPEKINKTQERFRIETGVSLKEAKTWLSTGFVAMLFALDVCKRIDVFGLANIDYCMRHPNSTSPYHYYEPGIRRECDYYKWSETQMTKGHKFITEKAVFARWSLGYNIHFHYPSWRATIRNVTAELETPFLQLYKEALKNGTLDQIRKAAPHVRVIRRIKVIRRRVRKPKPKVVVAPPKNETKSNDTMQIPPLNISRTVEESENGENKPKDNPAKGDNDIISVQTRDEVIGHGTIYRGDSVKLNKNGQILPIKRKPVLNLP